MAGWSPGGCVTEKPGLTLAEQLKAQIERSEAEEQQAALSRQRQESSAKQRRVALMGDLEAFGQAVGHLRISHRWGTLTLRYRGRAIRFKADGGDVVVSGDDLTGGWRCLFEPTLSRWVLQMTDSFGHSERILLFDAGLARLMSVGLRLG
ncbi:MAG: hypothetical protein ACI8RZ_005600 [Myxococcota bacterium]|jgi:hypothetical protein